MIEDERTYGFAGDRPRLIRLELGVLVAFALFAYVIPSIHSLIEFGPYQADVRLVEVWSAAGFIGLFLWIAWMSGDSFEMFGFSRPTVRDAKWLLSSILVTVLLVFLAILNAVLRVGGDYEIFNRVISSFSFDRCLSSFPLWLVLAGLEEIFYRGLVQTRAQEVWESRWVAIGGTAALFTLGHIYQGFHNLPWILLFGLAYSFLRSRGCPIWVLILTHALVNAFYSGLFLRHRRCARSENDRPRAPR